MKPELNITGQDGNIFFVLGAASKILKQKGLADQAVEMKNRVTSSGSYQEALSIIGEYVEYSID